jgi:ribosomal protein S9
LKNPLKSLNYSSAVSREDMIEIIDIFKNSDDADLNYLATEYQDDLDDDDLLWGKQLIADLERNGVDVYNTLLDLGYNSIVSPINKLNAFIDWDDKSLNINVIKPNILHIYSIQYEDVILQNPLDTGMRKWEKKKGIVLRDKENTITLIAYNTGNQETGTALYNKALIYKSVPPIRQANEIIEMLDNQQYEEFDESKIEDYKKSGHLIILNQNEVVYDSEKPNLSYADGGILSDNGVPITFYHGTTDKGYSSYKYLYFTADKEYASLYAEETGRIIEVYLKINNPFVIQAKYMGYGEIILDDEIIGYYRSLQPDAVEKLKNAGYDGIVVHYPFKNKKYFEVIPFDKSQIIGETFADGGLIAPNGNPSNLTAQQYKLVRTPEFKAWFGDWENDPENASKVVDENGEPKVVYHGSRYGGINIFNYNQSLRESSGLREYGNFFTDNIWVAELYRNSGKYTKEVDAQRVKEINKLENLLENVRNNREYDLINKEIDKWYSKTYEVFLNLKKVKEFDAELGANVSGYQKLKVDAGYKIATGGDAISFLKEGRFGVEKVDGIIAHNIVEMMQKTSDWEKYIGTSYLVFEPQNIKLADGTNTTFDLDSPDIRYADGGYMAKGGLSKTPAPKKDRVFGSDKNKVGSAASKESAKKINLSEDIITTLSNKAKEYNEENSGNKVTLNTLKAVMRRGMGAYSTSHRPTITGGAPNSRQAWGFARVNKFLKKKSGEKVKAAYVQDDDLLEMGGTINKNNLKMIQQHYHSMKPIEDIQVGDVYVIKEDMFAPHQDHEHPQHLSTRYATVEVKSPCHRNLDSYTLEVMDCDCDNAAGRYAKGKVIERSRKHILSSGKLKSAVAKATEFKDGGELNADSQEVKEYFAHDSGNAGGLLVGKRHSEGGIKADVKSTGQQIEMEGGEAVITRGAVNSKKKYVYEGKDMTTREILSDLNVKGGGVAFADGGDVPEKMNCGCSSMKVGGISYTPQDFITLSEKEYQEHRLIDGIEKERTDHFYTLAKLNSGAISIEQALREIASKEMMIDPKYPYSE